jgi:hypothetical protein
MPLLQMRPAEKPISTYSTVHTGPKMVLGGLKEGFSISMYQPSTAPAVISPEVLPTMSETRILMVTFQAGLQASRRRSVRSNMTPCTSQQPFRCGTVPHQKG